MKRASILLGLLLLSSVAAGRHGCSSCDAAKERMKCEYYVLKKGDLAQRSHCAAYAESIDVDGARGKAAWYFLLAGSPEKALEAANLAVDQGHTYALEYAAAAAMVLERKREAKAYMRRLGNLPFDRERLLRDFERLERLYPGVSFVSTLLPHSL
ncbi:hypothetical protein [Hydrogenimonas sp.]